MRSQFVHPYRKKNEEKTNESAKKQGESGKGGKRILFC